MKTFPQKKAKEEPKKKLQKKSKIDNQKIPNKEGKGGKEQKKEKQKKIKDESIYVMKKKYWNEDTKNCILDVTYICFCQRSYTDYKAG